MRLYLLCAIMLYCGREFEKVPLGQRVHVVTTTQLKAT